MINKNEKEKKQDQDLNFHNQYDIGDEVEIINPFNDLVGCVGVIEDWGSIFNSDKKYAVISLIEDEDERLHVYGSEVRDHEAYKLVERLKIVDYSSKDPKNAIKRQNELISKLNERGFRMVCVARSNRQFKGVRGQLLKHPKMVWGIESYFINKYGHVIDYHHSGVMTKTEALKLESQYPEIV